MRKIFGIIGIVLLCALSFGTFFGLARNTINDIAGFDFQTINEANIIKVDDYDIVNTEDEDSKLQVSVDEDGLITVDGENDTKATVELEVVTVSLEKGEYKFVSNAKGCSDKTYQLILKDNDDGVIIADEEFNVEAETATYTVYIAIYDGAEIDAKFAPVLVKKGENTDFFVNNWNPFKK